MRVTEVLAVEDLQNSETVAFSATPMFSRARHDTPLVWSGNLPVRAARAFELSGFDVRRLVGAP